MTLTREQYRDAITQASYIAALIQKLPVNELYDAQRWAVVFNDAPPDDELVIVEAMMKARRELESLAAREQQHPFSVEAFDAESGDASRVIAGQATC